MALEKLFAKILEKDIRMDIVLLLTLYKELNVTQISNLLNRNKATVGRHLKKMQQYGLLVSKEKESNRTINPLYYSMPRGPDTTLELVRKEEIDSSKNKTEKINKYRHSLSVAKMIYKLVEHAIHLIDPFFNSLNSKINEEDLEYIVPYLTWRRKLSIKHIVLSEENIDEFWEIYLKFYKKLETLSEKASDKNEKVLVFVDALLPLKEMLKFSGQEP